MKIKNQTIQRSGARDHVTERLFVCYQDRAKNEIKAEILAFFSAFISAVGFGRLAMFLYDI